MNKTPEQAREIVAVALESGEYTQGKTYLECSEGDGFVHCCLGVATREFMKHEDEEIDVGQGEDGSTRFDGSDCHLCDTVRDWLGFRWKNGVYAVSSLSVDNDMGMPFAKIAELFRNPPECLLA